MKTKLSNDLTARDEILDLVSRLKALRSSLAWVQDTAGQVQRAHNREKESAAAKRLAVLIATIDGLDTTVSALITDYAHVLIHSGPEQ